MWTKHDKIEVEEYVISRFYSETPLIESGKEHIWVAIATITPSVVDDSQDTVVGLGKNYLAALKDAETKARGLIAGNQVG